MGTTTRAIWRSVSSVAHELVESVERWDLLPGFWAQYKEPTSAVSALVQGPADKINGDTLADAYMSDWRKSRRQAD